MTQKEFKLISKTFSSAIATKLFLLEKEIDQYFIKGKKYKKRQYLDMKKIVMKVILKESYHVFQSISNELVNYAKIKNENKINHKPKNKQKT